MVSGIVLGTRPPTPVLILSEHIQCKRHAGRTVVDRLIYIIPYCPGIAAQAFLLALEQIRTMRDITLYTALLQVYDQTVMTFGVENGLVPRQELAQTDQRWIEETGRRNQEERAKLEVELKNYQSNLIRESIRVSGLKLWVLGDMGEGAEGRAYIDGT